MWLNYSKDRELEISMEQFLNDIISEFFDEISKTTQTPASAHLFEVRDKSDRLLLDDKRSHAFHRSVAQLLFACARCRKDIHTTVAFLTTRFREPDEDDWKKLRRLLEYLRGTIKLGMFLRADSLNVIKWWVDASYAIHPDMKVHTGANMSLGGGSAISMSKKHKLNECSSTGAEVIGVDEVMLHMLWTKYFCEEQGYLIEENIMYQTI